MKIHEIERRQPDATHLEIDLYLDPALLWFKGHFAVQPLLPGVAQQCCDCELNAIEAERMVDDLKKAEYMHDRIGETFSGVVSGVTPRALFLELENTVEGVLPLENVEDDFFGTADNAAHGIGMTADVFGGGMHYNVNA